MIRPPPARLHVLLAREAPLGLVIRHGTGKSVCTILWDRRRDRFTLGQWMRGRIESEHCDLSPDGAHFIYTARRYVHPEARGWTAVSRAPHLKALAYYPLCWGGGWFANNREYCVAHGSSHAADRESPEVRRVKADAPTPSLFAARMARAGWTADDRGTRFRGGLQFFRAVGFGWELRQYPEGGYLLSCRDELLADTAGWEWADVDGKRVVWTRGGCLYAAGMRTQGPGKTELLHDFNGMKFQAITAPYEGGRPVPPEPSARRAPVRKFARKPLRKKPARGKIRPEPGEDDGC